MVQVQGEMDAAGGQVEGIGRAVVNFVVVLVVGCRVVVEILLQLVKPNGLRLVKLVPFEQVPP